MKLNGIIRLAGLVAVFLLFLSSFSAPFQQIASLPSTVRALQGTIYPLPTWISTQIQPVDQQVLALTAPTVSAATSSKETLALKAQQPGEAVLQLKLFGKIPFKTVYMDVLPDLKLIPGGQSIGVQLHAAGVMVVGFHSSSKEESPAQKANLQVGDLILRTNGKAVQSTEQFMKKIQDAGKSETDLQLEVARGKDKLQVQVHPQKNDIHQNYQIGLYIRDSAAGVGTLTFYEPKEKVYGALGHVITDIDTQQPIILRDGNILPSEVSAIDKGENGAPGQKRAFFNEKEPIGIIEKNSTFGIFGKMYEQPQNLLIKKPLPVALAEQVEKGPAEIYTVIAGSEVKRYDIEITDVFPQRYPATKGMIIKVTDPDLLQSTGGIVQGMSGSPIIQNGHMVGAVTHVFVNDPTSGYGTFIEWMLRDAELLRSSSLPSDAKEKAA